MSSGKKKSSDLADEMGGKNNDGDDGFGTGKDNK
jgi:hypothetical protein